MLGELIFLYVSVTKLIERMITKDYNKFKNNCSQNVFVLGIKTAVNAFGGKHHASAPR